MKLKLFQQNKQKINQTICVIRFTLSWLETEEDKKKIILFSENVTEYLYSV